MRRREAPPLARWALRHLIVGDPNEALDGDLLEVFRTGRSNGWYWRQVIAACGVSWCRSLYDRGHVLVFALLWSMLSPVWYATINGIEVFERASQTLGLLWLPLALIGWTSLHAIFLWAGLLIYLAVHTVLGKPLQRKDLRRAFCIVPLVFPPVYGATFLMANLYWYSLPGLAHAKLAATSWGQVSDLGILPLLIRFPYLVALLVALWGTICRVGYDVNPRFVDSVAGWTPTEPDAITVAPMPESTAIGRFLALMVVAGLVNSMIVALLLCRLPESQTASLTSLCLRALVYVASGVLGGIAGSWLYWKSPASPLRGGSPVPFTLFALTCAAGWVWVPAMMLFSEQVSAATAGAAMIGAFTLATGLKCATYFVFTPAQPQTPQWERGELFAESLYRPPFELHGYVIALGLFAAVVALASRSNYTAAALLAMSAFVFAWKNTIPRREAVEGKVQLKRAVIRVASVAVPAILLTLWALLDGVAHRNEAARARAATKSDARPSAYVAPNPKASFSESEIGGYESVVLWPYPEKKQIMSPLAVDDSMLSSETKRPLIIRFDGLYWFLQPPSKRPGLDAHVAQGTPTKVNIESNNAIQLVMDAHQKLSRAIWTAQCRQIEIEVENRDNKAGLVSLGLLLSDEDSSSKKTVYLGQQPIITTEPGHFFFKTKPVFETLRFSLSANAPIRKFNEITVMFLPDIEHTFVAPKIAIRQFELFPR
ncbi:MAG TPA: hypothetical protein VKB47_04600 [Terracidiphilus sp.]|nr:hypothetical protein [Terracidiphilus sp.]